MSYKPKFISPEFVKGRNISLYKKRGSNLRVGSDGYCLFDMNRPMHTAVTLGLLFVGLISTTERE